jgi:hypothetical protein
VGFQASPATDSRGNEPCCHVETPATTERDTFLGINDFWDGEDGG